LGDKRAQFSDPVPAVKGVATAARHTDDGGVQQKGLQKPHVVSRLGHGHIGLDFQEVVARRQPKAHIVGGGLKEGVVGHCQRH